MVVERRDLACVASAGRLQLADQIVAGAADVRRDEFFEQDGVARRPGFEQA